MGARLGLGVSLVLALALAACGSSGSSSSSSTNAATTGSTTTTSARPAPSTSAPTTPRVTSVSYKTGQPEAGYSTYDLFTGNCTTFVATYEYSFMGTVQGPTPTRIPAGTVMQVGSSIRVPGPLPGGVPYPKPNQAGILRNSRYSLVTYQCG